MSEWTELPDGDDAARLAVERTRLRQTDNSVRAEDGPQPAAPLELES